MITIKVYLVEHLVSAKGKPYAKVHCTPINEPYTEKYKKIVFCDFKEENYKVDDLLDIVAWKYLQGKEVEMIIPLEIKKHLIAEVVEDG